MEEVKDRDVPVAFDPNDGLVIARQQFGSTRHEKQPTPSAHAIAAGA
jgi:hypothetical protein